MRPQGTWEPRGAPPPPCWAPQPAPPWPPAGGGHQLRELDLSTDLFAVAAMQQVSKDLLAMTVAELKEELEARGESKSGNKAWLPAAPPAAACGDRARVYL